MNVGNRYGEHRVIYPPGALPQAAQRLDNQKPPLDNEIGITVQALHITSTSFYRLWNEADENANSFANKIKEIVSSRGKFQDPVTGSGGVLKGVVDFVGPALNIALKVGDPIVTMVSLALTPLRLDQVYDVHPASGQVEVQGYAILFESGLWAILPSDLPVPLAMIALDVAGAPAYAARHVRAGQRILVIGGGKAGMLCLHEIKKHAGSAGQVILVEKNADRCQAALELGLADEALNLDATRALDVFSQINNITNEKLADVCFNCASLPGTEMATILSTRDDGEIFFFSMATEFSRAALGAEGVGKPVRMIIGNGYLPGHAEIALRILRENKPLRDYLSRCLA